MTIFNDHLLFRCHRCGGQCPGERGNHLGQRISCVPGQGCVYHKLVNASKHRIGVTGGVEVAGMWLDPGYGYSKCSRSLCLPV